MAARLKLFGDRLLGPNADAAIIEGLTALRREGREPAVPFRVDERVLKPRVAGFLAVGGSLTSQWKTLALPIMHTTTFSMHIAVVDQVQFEGAGTPRSIVLDPAAHRPRRAARAATSPASSARAFDEAALPGRRPGPVPDVPPRRRRPARRGRRVRHLRRARPARRRDLTVTWTDLTTSVISMDEKRAHAAEIQETASRHAALRAEIEDRAREFDAYDPIVRPDPRPT